MGDSDDRQRVGRSRTSHAVEGRLGEQQGSQFGLGDDHEGVGSYQSLTVWGWLEDWNATVIGPDDVNMTIDIQGLK